MGLEEEETQTIKGAENLLDEMRLVVAEEQD